MRNVSRIGTKDSLPSTASIIHNIFLIPTDREELKQQLIDKIQKLVEIDDIIQTIEQFLAENNTPFFSFFNSSRLNKNLITLLEGLKTARDKHLSRLLEKNNYHQYDSKHDKCVDAIIKIILQYNATRQSMDTLERIAKDFEKTIKKIRLFCIDDEKAELKNKLASQKIDRLLQSMEIKNNNEINAFETLVKLRFSQFLHCGLSNLKSQSRISETLDKILEEKICFNSAFFEFSAERETLLAELINFIRDNKTPCRGAEKNSKINAGFMIADLIKNGYSKSEHYKWLTDKILLLTNSNATEDDLNDLVRFAHTESIESPKSPSSNETTTNSMSI